MMYKKPLQCFASDGKLPKTIYIYGPQPLEIEYSIESTPVLLCGSPIYIPAVEEFSFWTGCGAFLESLASAFGILGFFGVSGKDFIIPLVPLAWPCLFLW